MTNDQSLASPPLAKPEKKEERLLHRIFSPRIFFGVLNLDTSSCNFPFVSRKSYPTGSCTKWLGLNPVRHLAEFVSSSRATRANSRALVPVLQVEVDSVKE